MTSDRKTDLGTNLSACTEHEVALFWARVVRRDGRCWAWTGARLPSGYGFITRNVKVDGRRRGVTLYAHRIAYEIEKGPVPAGLSVRHACDNPGCVNPDHLSVGSQQDNVDDMMLRGRHNMKWWRGWQDRMRDDDEPGQP